MKEALVQCRIDGHMLTSLERACRKLNRTQSDLVREWIYKGLDNLDIHSEDAVDLLREIRDLLKNET